MYMALRPVKQDRKHKTLLSFKEKVASFLIEPEMKRKMAKNTGNQRSPYLLSNLG
jgi:hypothetical protein